MSEQILRKTRATSSRRARFKRAHFRFALCSLLTDMYFARSIE